MARSAALTLALLWVQPAHATRCVERDWVAYSDLIVRVKMTDSTRLAPEPGEARTRWRYEIVEVMKGQARSRGTVTTIRTWLGDDREPDPVPTGGSEGFFEVGEQYVLFFRGPDRTISTCSHVIPILPGGERSESTLSELRAEIRGAK